MTEAPNAEHLYDLLVSTLVDVTGLSEEQLGAKLVGMGCDGASVMQGHSNGLVALVRGRLAARISGWHCAAHRLNLCMGAMDQEPVMKRISDAVDHVNNFFSPRWGTGGTASGRGMCSWAFTV